MSAIAARPVRVFCVFAFCYFLSALLRAVTATLAPEFSREMGLRAADLGLLAGAYFFGFAATQLPLGGALDRFGPRHTLMSLLVLAVLGCAAFALAPDLPTLIAARVLTGVGVGACLMAPLTCFRTMLTPPAQLRANSWMLMTGSLGMVASTLPVQWLLPVLGWRGLFWALAAMLVLSIGLVAAAAPRPGAASLKSVAGAAATGGRRCEGEGEARGYAGIARNPLFVRMAPLGFFVYGGLIAIQSLWAGPWLTRVAAVSAEQAARGLFGLNLSMLATFMLWGVVMPRLARRGVGALRVVTWGVPISLALLLINIAQGPSAAAGHWALWCMACTSVTVSHPAIGATFSAARAGRALAAFNLVIFTGVFSIQWGIGLLVDRLHGAGLTEPDAFRAAFGVFAAASIAAYLWFLYGGRRRLP